MTQITQCRSCHSDRLKDIGSVGEQYLSTFLDSGEPRPDKYPLELTLCSNCTLLQLKESIPVDKLYTENYGYKSGVNTTIRNDLQDIVNKATRKVVLNSGDYVLDIGANDGTLLSFYPSYILKIACEPIKKLADEAKQHANYLINDFFSLEAYQKVMNNKTYGVFKKKPKVITIISCFYDLEDPNKFVSDLTRLLHDDGVIVIQQNYLGSMVKQHAFDNIVHEHIEYYSLKSLEHLLNRYMLEVIDLELNDINGGSFRVFVKFMNPVKQLRIQEEKMKIDNWGTFFLFFLKIKEIKNKVHGLLVDLRIQGKKVYVYGASTRGNSLLQYFELDNKLVQKAVERNPEKFGKYIGSLHIPIISEEQARADKPDYMLVCPWFFKKEFVEREKEYLESGGHLIFPLPELEIV
jgi:NDP-4-keto-2,6-dideoxyhexose 3-C-methyltransferase